MKHTKTPRRCNLSSTRVARWLSSVGFSGCLRSRSACWRSPSNTATRLSAPLLSTTPPSITDTDFGVASGATASFGTQKPHGKFADKRTASPSVSSQPLATAATAVAVVPSVSSAGNAGKPTIKRRPASTSVAFSSSNGGAKAGDPDLVSAGDGQFQFVRYWRGPFGVAGAIAQSNALSQ